MYNTTTGSDNTASGYLALFSNNVGIDNTAAGSFALNTNVSGNYNTGTGRNALRFNYSGQNNTATGVDALVFNNGSQNTATGRDALYNNGAGNNNTAEGYQALYNTGGSNNIALGASAGINLANGSFNIEIGHIGAANDNRVIRIGTPRTQTNAFMAGIWGVTVPAGIPVIVDINGHLGTTTSSARFKDNISPMAKASEAILALEPVSFRYKKELDPDKVPQFGLVAEQVEKIDPDLVVHDEQGKPYSVRYEAVNAMLLNEFLKEHRKVAAQESTITQLEAKATKQDREIAALTASVKEQSAKIQKVSAELAVSRPAPRVVSTR